MNIYEYSANLSGSISYSFFCNRRNRTRKYKNKQSMSHTMGIGTGIRLSANNGQQISSSFQKFQDFMPFPTKSIAWNVFITSIPFSLTLIASTYDQDEILFFLSYYTATLIYAIGIGMLRISSIPYADLLCQ